MYTATAEISIENGERYVIVEVDGPIPGRMKWQESRTQEVLENGFLLTITGEIPEEVFRAVVESLDGITETFGFAD